MSKYFNAVEKHKFANCGEITESLEILLNTLFPENGIEYWSDNRFGSERTLKPGSLVPLVFGEEGVRHVGSYVRLGGCEGRVIEISLFMKDRTVLSLGWIKSFGSHEECWEMARVITEVLESILFYEETPAMIQMTRKMPRQQAWHRVTSFKDQIVVRVGVDSLTVTAGAQTLDERSFSSQGDFAHFSVDAFLKDWVTVLTGLKANFRVILPRDIVIPSLPGYVFSEEGGETVTGYRVLPPGERAEDNRLGVFNSLSAAVSASVMHQRRAQV